MPGKPQASIHRSLSSRLWYWFSKQVVHAVATLVYRVRHTGLENVPRTGGMVIVSNHQSHLDPPAIGCGFPLRINYLARKDLFHFAPFAWLIDSYDAIPIDRKGSALGGVRETLRRLRRGESVLMFPEGTRTWDGEIGPFMSGFAVMAMRGRAGVLPVALEGAFDAWPRSRRFPWVGPIHVHFGPLIRADEVQSMTEQELLAETEKRIRQCQQVLRARPVFARRRRQRGTAALGCAEGGH